MQLGMPTFWGEKRKKEKMAEKNRPLAAVLDWVTQWLDSIKSFQSQMHRKLDQGIDCQSNTNDWLRNRAGVKTMYLC